MIRNPLNPCAPGLGSALALALALAVGWPEAGAAQVPPPGTADPSPNAGARQPGVQVADASPEAPPHGLAETSLSLAFSLTLTDAPREALDNVLSAFDYEDAPRIWGGDLTVTAKVAGPLWLGGRADLRAREWDKAGSSPASAFQAAALFVAELRLPVNAKVDVASILGVGAGIMSFRIHDAAETYFVPRLEIAASMGVTIQEPLRLFVRIGWELAQANDIDGEDHDLNLGGAFGGIGIEARL